MKDVESIGVEGGRKMRGNAGSSGYNGKKNWTILAPRAAPPLARPAAKNVFSM